MAKAGDQAKKALVKQIGKAVGKRVAKGAAKINPAECLRELAKAFFDYKKVTQQEKSTRRKWEAWEKVHLEKIRVQRKILFKYLDSHYKERKMIFSRQFDALDKAISSKDTQRIGFVLHSIVELGKTSPFEKFLTPDAVDRMLEDPNQEPEF